MSREEYFKKYYEEHKQEIIDRAKKYYKSHKKECLTYQEKRYILNRERILAKNKNKSLAFRGHAYSIWTAIKKYAVLWGLPICTFQEFYDNWTFDDPTYQELYDAWISSEYDEYLSPVVMRRVKKNGFVSNNLKWDVKKNYSWWSEDAAIFKKIENNLDKQQKERNDRGREWRKKIREEWKAKKKNKRQ